MKTLSPSYIDSVINAMETIARLRREKKLPPFLRPGHTNLALGWHDLYARGVLSRWISMLEHYKPGDGGDTK